MRSVLATLAFGLAGCLLDATGIGPEGTASTGTGGIGVGGAPNGGGAAGGGAGDVVGGGGAGATGGQSEAGGGGSGGTIVLDGGGGEGGSPCVDIEGSCEPWWNPGWGARRRIEVSTAQVGVPLQDFPILVLLDATLVDYAAMQQSGGDLRFVAEDGVTVLSHEIEAWNAGNGQSFVWVRVPLIPAAPAPSVIVWMYSENMNAPAASSPASTWGGDFVSVHHFNAGLADASPNGHNGTSATAPTPTAGVIAGAMDFDGSNDHVVLGGESAYDFTNAMSVSAWVRVDSFGPNWQAIVAKGDTAWRLHRHNGANQFDFGTSHANVGNSNEPHTDDVTTTTWHHTAVTYDGTTKTIYLDATPTTLAFNAAIRPNDFAVCIGENNESTGRHFNGQIDEVRVSSVWRPPSWMSMEHRLVTNNAAVVSFSDEQLPP